MLQPDAPSPKIIAAPCVRAAAGKLLIGKKKREGQCLSRFSYVFFAICAPWRISRSTGTLTHSDAATKHAMPTMRFTLMCS